MTVQVVTPASPAAPAGPSTPAAPAASAAPTGTPAVAATPAPGAPPETPPAQSEFARAAIQLRKLEKEKKTLQDQLAAGTKDRELLALLRDPEKRYDAIEKELGISYEALTERRLRAAGYVPPAEPEIKLPKEVQDRLAKLDELLAERDTTKQTQAQQARQQEVEGAVTYVRDTLVKGNPEKYALIGALNAHGMVVQRFAQLRDAEGADPDEHAVAAAIETELAASLETQLTSLIATPKGKELLTKLLTPAAPQANPQANPGSTPLGLGKKPALSNDLSAQPGNGIDTSKLSKGEKRQRALVALK